MTAAAAPAPLIATCLAPFACASSARVTVPVVLGDSREHRDRSASIRASRALSSRDHDDAAQRLGGDNGWRPRLWPGPARVACSVCTLMVVLAGSGCFALTCPLLFPLDLVHWSVASDAAADTRARARSRELLAHAEDARGRDDWPCPPDCRSGYVCVHSELVGHGICRPRCDLEVDLCSRPARCTPVTGAEAACVDRALVGSRRPQAEPVAPPPPLLEQ